MRLSQTRPAPPEPPTKTPTTSRKMKMNTSDPHTKPRESKHSRLTSGECQAGIDECNDHVLYKAPHTHLSLCVGRALFALSVPQCASHRQWCTFLKMNSSTGAARA